MPNLFQYQVKTEIFNLSSPVETITLDKWYSNLSIPLNPNTINFANILNFIQADPILNYTTAFNPANDNSWYAALSVPVLPVPPAFYTNSFNVNVNSSFLFPEVVTVDKWFNPLSGPDFAKHKFLNQLIEYYQFENFLTLVAPNTVLTPNNLAILTALTSPALTSLFADQREFIELLQIFAPYDINAEFISWVETNFTILKEGIGLLKTLNVEGLNTITGAIAGNYKLVVFDPVTNEPKLITKSDFLL